MINIQADVALAFCIGVVFVLTILVISLYHDLMQMRTGVVVLQSRINDVVDYLREEDEPDPDQPDDLEPTGDSKVIKLVQRRVA